jgi:hypothetical protein
MATITMTIIVGINCPAADTVTVKHFALIIPYDPTSVLDRTDAIEVSHATCPVTSDQSASSKSYTLLRQPLSNA